MKNSNLRVNHAWTTSLRHVHQDVRDVVFFVLVLRLPALSGRMIQFALDLCGCTYYDILRPGSTLHLAKSEFSF